MRSIVRVTACVLWAAAGAAFGQAEAQDAYRKAAAAYAEGRFAEARELAEKAAATDPGNPEPALLLGKAEYQLGNVEAAFTAWKKVAALAPDEPYVHAMLAALSAANAPIDARIAFIRVLRDEGAVAPALQEVDAMLARSALSTSQRAALMMLGAALRLDGGVHDDAVMRAHEALVLYPRDVDRAEAACILGQAKVRKGGPAAQEGRELLAEVVAEHAGTNAALAAQGELLMSALKESATAENLAAFERWLAAAPGVRRTRCDAFRLRADAACALGRAKLDAYVRAGGLADPAAFEGIAADLDRAIKACDALAAAFSDQPAWRELLAFTESMVAAAETTPCPPALAEARPIDALIARLATRIAAARPDADAAKNAAALLARALAPYAAADAVPVWNAAAALSRSFFGTLPPSSAAWQEHAGRHAALLDRACACEFKANVQAHRSNAKLSPLQEEMLSVLAQRAAVDAAAARGAIEQLGAHLAPWIEAGHRQAARDAWEKLGASLPAAERRIAGRKVAELLVAEARHDEETRTAAGLPVPRALDSRFRGALERCYGLQAGADASELAELRRCVDAIVEHLVRLERFDVAEEALKVKTAEVVAEADEHAEFLAAGLKDTQARAELARLLASYGAAEKLALTAGFEQALAAYARCAVERPRSALAARAVDGIFAIAQLYQEKGAHAVAAGIYRECATAAAEAAMPPLAPGKGPLVEHAELMAARALDAHARGILAAARATDASTTAPPSALSPEFVQALEAYKAFVAAHAESPHAAAAIAGIFGIARVHASSRTWAAAEAAIADFEGLGRGVRDPERLAFLRGVCRLGAAMPAHALAVLDAVAEGKPIPEIAPAGGDQVAVQTMEPQPAPVQTMAQNAPMPAPPVQVQQRASPQENTQEAEQAGQRRPAPAALADAELARVAKAFDGAYEVFQAVIKSRAAAPPATWARAEILGMVGHWRSLGQWKRAAALAARFLADNPADGGLAELRLAIARDLLAWAAAPIGRTQDAQASIAEVTERAQAARAALDAFVKDFPGERARADAARWDFALSFFAQARALAGLSATLARGQYVRAAAELEKLASPPRAHARAQEVAPLLWQIAAELEGRDFHEEAIVVWQLLRLDHAAHPLAEQAGLRIAQTYHEKLAQPLRAAEAYQELHFARGGDAGVLDAIFRIGNELFAQKRWVEALHILETFADSFPGHALAGQALAMAGQIHQTNEAWEDAIAAYRRVIGEYPEGEWVKEARWAIAECTINLSRWQAAAEAYRAYVAAYPEDGRAGEATARIEVLKDLARYQGLVDEAGQRKAFDAQFQIAGIVGAKLANPVKAIIEYRKVVAAWPESHLADDALHAIGTAYLALGETVKAREVLLAVAEKYPASPLADDALLAVGKSYEDEAERLGAATRESSREIAKDVAQRNAYRNVQSLRQAQKESRAGFIAELKKGGKGAIAEAEEASFAGNWGQFNDANVDLVARKAVQEVESLTASQLADRQDKIAAALRKAVEAYAGASQVAGADKADEALLQMASIHDTRLKNPEAAMQTWREIVRLFSGTAVAENASWRLCQYYERNAAWAEAIEAHKAFVRNYRRSPMAGQAQYAVAEAYEHLGEWVAAMDSYTNYAMNFPEGPLVAKAKEQINWIKTYRL